MDQNKYPLMYSKTYETFYKIEGNELHTFHTANEVIENKPFEICEITGPIEQSEYGFQYTVYFEDEDGLTQDTIVPAVSALKEGINYLEKLIKDYKKLIEKYENENI